MVSDLTHWTFRGKRSTSGRQVKVKGFRLDKDGRLVKNIKRLDVSAQLRQRGSKRVRVAKRGTTT